MARIPMVCLLILIMGNKTIHSEEVQDSELENNICGADREEPKKRGSPFRTFTEIGKDELWENAEVPWSYASVDNEYAEDAADINENVGLNKNDVDTVKAAMKQIEASTCIKFKKVTPVRGEPWLFIHREARASDRSCQRSYAQDNLVGKDIKGLGDIYKGMAKIWGQKEPACFRGAYASYGSDSPQFLVISSTRGSVGLMVHELLHNLGVGHTQKRQDADKNIKIIWENIRGEGIYQYKPSDHPRYETHGTEYNCESIMHYRDTSFITEEAWGRGEKTMVAINPSECNLSKPNRILTKTDVEILKKMYCVNSTGGPLYKTSPNHPDNYPDKTDKEIPISVEDGQVVNLWFTAFDIEEDDTCSFDWVKVLDADGTMLLKKTCGNVIPDSIISRTNNIVIQFHSDDSVNRAGFRAEYEAVPSTKPLGESGEVTSPGYPNNYADSQTNTTDLWVPIGSRIELTVTDLSIESEDLQGKQCWDHLKIFDGADQDGELLKELCGYAVPVEPFISTGNAMTLVFTADSNVNYKGFRATWKQI